MIFNICAATRKSAEPLNAFVLNFWDARVFERVKQKFIDMNINRDVNHKVGYTGDLHIIKELSEGMGNPSITER